MPETEENVEQTQEQTDKWDADRQKIDQLSANVTKMANDKAELTGQLSAMSERSQEMQDTVSRLEQQLSSAQVAKTESESLDSDMYDEKLIQKISKLEAMIGNASKAVTESNAKIKELDAAKTQFETNAANEQEATRKAERKEMILTDLDTEFSPKYRNAALKLAQDEVTQSGVAPDGEYAVAALLRKHYKALSVDPGSVPKTTSSVAVDTGDGGVVFQEGDIQDGSRDEVLASIRTKMKGRSFTMPQT